MTDYRRRILNVLARLVDPLNISHVLDFGSGDGYFASHVATWQGISDVTAIDVVHRRDSLMKPLIYDGRVLPFDDRSFDLVYAIDVLHHCAQPLEALTDIARCADRYLVIKDHTYKGALGRWTLALLDEIGNRRFGIPSPRNYQRHWEWVEALERSGWCRLALHHPLRCHTGVLGTLTNSLQWIGLWERAETA